MPVIGLLMTSCADEEQAPPEPVIRPVRYQQVFGSGGARVRAFSGAAQASTETEISFKVPGTLRRLSVEVGDLVRANDLLAELDPRDYELQVEQVRASLAQGRARARNAAATYERVRGLYENNNASKADLDTARTAAESADATVRSIEKQLELAELQLSYTRLRAPVDGAVAEVPVEVNENVSTGQPVATITSGARPEVLVAVPESLITRIRRGNRVTVQFDALQGRTYGAAVTEVGVSPTKAATTFPVTARLDQANPMVLPGMAAEVAFRFAAREGGARFVVFPHAVSEDRKGNFVYVVEPSEEGLGIVHRRHVKVGELVTEGLEILEGLADGDLVVTAGVSRIADGQQVKLLGSN
jgi:RND family efflux transporter MFP subunit